MNPSKGLVLAIFLRAISDFHGHGIPPHIRADARRWFITIYRSPRPGSFQWACDALDIDSVTVRNLVLAYNHASPQTIPSSNPNSKRKNKTHTRSNGLETIVNALCPSTLGLDEQYELKVYK